LKSKVGGGFETGAGPRSRKRKRANGILLLAQSNYEVHSPHDSRLSERVIFPTSPSQRNGSRRRFVLFREEDGTRIYYATYTAYDGKLILPQFLRRRIFCISNSSP